MSKIHPHMSIPEFLDMLSLDQIDLVIDLSNKRKSVIESKDKTTLYVFSSGMVNEGFYRTEEEAVQALKDYVQSKEYSRLDVLEIIKIREFPDEVERLLKD